VNRATAEPTAEQRVIQHAAITRAAALAVRGLADGASDQQAWDAAREAIAPMWPDVFPETAADLITDAGNHARQYRVWRIPRDLPMDKGADLADGILVLSAGLPCKRGQVKTAAQLFALGAAFDRDEDADAAMLGAVALLLGLGLRAEAAAADPEAWVWQ
jgi:hypothetical protein